MKLMLLVNPAASNVDWKSRMAANSALIGGHDLTTVETTKRDDATGIARQAAWHRARTGIHASPVRPARRAG